MDKLRFQSFASGSSGNCYYIGNASRGILIDAGIGVRTIRKCLRSMGLDFENLWGVFVTHDHADHIKSVGVLGEKYNVPVYSTALVHEGIQRSYCVTEKLYGSKRIIEKYQVIEFGDLKISAFPVSHDATDNVGYTIEYHGKKFSFATDLGYVSPETRNNIKDSDFMVFEANYDEQMMDEGGYPAHLKERIKSNTGHLSNTQAAEFLSQTYQPDLKYIFLCHLSRENNLPEIAFSTVNEALLEKNIVVGSDVHLVTLDRFTPSELYVFD